MTAGANVVLHGRLTGRVPKAVKHLCAALSQDPLLWCAFEELCHLGRPLLCTNLMILTSDGAVAIFLSGKVHMSPVLALAALSEEVHGGVHACLCIYVCICTWRRACMLADTIPLTDIPPFHPEKNSSPHQLCFLHLFKRV